MRAQAEPGELVDHVQDPDRTPVTGPPSEEVVGPDVVAIPGRQAAGAARVLAHRLQTRGFRLPRGTHSPSRRHKRSTRFLFTGQPSSTSSPWIIRYPHIGCSTLSCSQDELASQEPLSLTQLGVRRDQGLGPGKELIGARQRDRRQSLRGLAGG